MPASLRPTLSFQNDLPERDIEQPVVLAAGEGSYFYFLGQGIRAHVCNRRHVLRLIRAEGAAAVDAVRRRRAHLCVASLETLPADLSVEPFTCVGQVLAMPKQHALSKCRRVRLEDLAGLGLIVPPAGRPIA